MLKEVENETKFNMRVIADSNAFCTGNRNYCVLQFVIILR